MKSQSIWKIVWVAQISAYLGAMILSIRHYFVYPANHYPLLMVLLILGFIPSIFAHLLSFKKISWVVVCNGLYLVSSIYFLMEESALSGLFLLVPVLSLLFKNIGLYVFSSVSSMALYLLLTQKGTEPQLVVTILDQMTIFLIMVLLISVVVRELIKYSTVEAKHLQSIFSLARSVEAKDPYTRGHSERVAWISRFMAQKVPGLDPEMVFQTGLIHDVGKLTTPDHILLKKGRLSNEEYEVMKQHPEEGAKVCRSLNISEEFIKGVLYHHERWDGRGYPKGLEKQDIPLIARVMAVADSIDAMASNRAYRKSLANDVIKNEVLNGSGSQFDPTIAEIALLHWDDIVRYLQENQQTDQKEIEALGNIG